MAKRTQKTLIGLTERDISSVVRDFLGVPSRSANVIARLAMVFSKSNAYAQPRREFYQIANNPIPKRRQLRTKPIRLANGVEYYPPPRSKNK